VCMCAIMYTYTKTCRRATMLTTLKVKNGVYTDMQYYNKQRDVEGDIVTYIAKFILFDGYTEMRFVSVQNDKVVAWNT